MTAVTVSVWFSASLSLPRIVTVTAASSFVAAASSTASGGSLTAVMVTETVAVRVTVPSLTV